MISNFLKSSLLIKVIKYQNFIYTVGCQYQNFIYTGLCQPPGWKCNQKVPAWEEETQKQPTRRAHWQVEQCNWGTTNQWPSYLGNWRRNGK